MLKIRLKGTIEVPVYLLSEIKQALSLHIDLSRNEPGCLVFEVKQDDKSETIFHVYEEFVDQLSFDNHQARIKRSEWGRISKNLKRNYDIFIEDSHL